MSTGFECEYVEYQPGEWYWVLQDWDCPKGAWNWREYATVTGPFTTEDEARKHLLANNANPGGSWTIPYAELASHDGAESYAKLIAEAEAPKPVRYERWFR